MDNDDIRKPITTNIKFSIGDDVDPTSVRGMLLLGASGDDLIISLSDNTLDTSPTAWGEILVEVAHHLAQAFSENGMTFEEALGQIKNAMERELASCACIASCGCPEDAKEEDFH